MAYTLSARSLRNLKGVHADLVRVVRHALELTPIDFVVIEGLRTMKRQQELVATGASQTMNSRHIGGYAVDVAALLGGKVRWDSGLYYRIAGAFQKASKQLAVPIRWGGAWVRLDTTSIEPADLVARYAARAYAAGRKPFIDSSHFELSATHYP